MVGDLKTTSIKYLKIQILSFIEMGFPGWVLCAFQDVSGNTHTFEEKVPVVSSDFLDENSDYPQDGLIGCEILEEHENVITIDLMNPRQIQTQNGENVFKVFSNQIG